MRFTLPNTGLVAVLLVAFAPVAVAQEKTGAAIYQQLCVRCHGATGEGTKKAPQPLVGEKSIAQLAAVIDRTMPEDDPSKCDAVESKQVAVYIHDTFYSPDARAKSNPPRVELSHLTVGQYRNAIADIVGSFRQTTKLDDKRGLHAEYYNSRNFQGNKKLIDRVDPKVEFDFGTVGPEVEKGDKFDPTQFCARWEGSVLAPESGSYEFVVRTDHALRLWVNDAKAPLIDAWVKSGPNTEFRGSIFLLAGRSYALRLEFSKAKQGVDDSKKNPNPPAKPASISLLWKLPHKAAEVIPARHLSPARASEVAVVETPFPPDDRSLGWVRGTTISKEWDAATTDAALEVAGYIAARLPELAGVQDGSAERGPKLREFCRKFAERAFRRPLTAVEKQQFVDRHFDAVPDPLLAVKRVVLVVLKSPRFLYLGTSGGPEAYAIASRLSLTLWDSLPDQQLLDAAAAGKLGTQAEVAKHAERMLADPRARAKVREFLLTWLKVSQAPELAKDAKRFPGFDAALASDLRTSLELFLDEIVWSEASDFRQLLLSNDAFLNGRLAKFYGAELPSDAGFTKVKFDPDRRAGVLTHPYILSALAYSAESSPIHRGVFVGRGLLGITLRPPPDAFTPLPADAHPNLTTRERVALQTKPDACISCHGVMNPLGFALENFDAVGRFREKENAKPIDVAGGYETRAGTAAKFNGAKPLTTFLANSEEVHAAFAQQLFHHMVKQPVRAYGLRKPDELQKSFAENAYSIRKLMVAVAVMTSRQ